MELQVVNRLGYRADLDGLRAVAVVPVVLYHLGFQLLPGGFVGVDIFFVLSGFLITSLIYTDLACGKFSLAGFYDRRIRRIVPAFAVMLFAICGAALYVLLPEQLIGFSTTLVAAGLGLSNILFAEAYVGYFSPDAALEPLLHTWTLALEAQFYLLFPLFLWAAWSWSREWLPRVVWLGLAVSLALSIWGVWAKPVPTFYLLPTRTWEFLIGSALALRLVPTPSAYWNREAAAGIGVLAILASTLIFTHETPFPGLAALLPCLGAALVIWAGLDCPTRSTWAGYLLSARLPVFIGVISYSLYLWHWPLIVFAKHLTSGHLTPMLQIALAVSATALAVTSWRYIEKPLRAGRLPWPTRRHRFAGAGVALLAIAFLGAGLGFMQGLPQRLSVAVVELSAKSQDFSPLRSRCHAEDLASATFAETCVLGAAVPPDVIVFADSHGAELSLALSEAAQARQASIRQVTASGCPPAYRFLAEAKPECAAYVVAMLEAMSKVSKRTVVIAAHSFRWSARGRNAHYWSGLEETIRALRGGGHTVVLLGAVPPHPRRVSIPYRLARWVQFGGQPEEYRFPLNQSIASDIEANLRRIADATEATYLPLVPYLCPDATGCRAFIDDTVMYFDHQHLSVSAAKRVVKDILGPAVWPSS